MDLCMKVLKESNKTKFDSYSVRNSVLIISHIIIILSYPTIFLEITVYSVTPSTKQTNTYRQSEANF